MGALTEVYKGYTAAASTLAEAERAYATARRRLEELLLLGEVSVVKVDDRWVVLSRRASEILIQAADYAEV